MLKGQELLAKIQEMGTVSRTDVARACGYVSTKKNGSERINFTAFYEAISEAKGVTLAPPASKAAGPKRGKPLSFKVKASKTGVIPVTAGYSALIGVGDGDHVTIDHVDGGLMLRKAPTAAPEAQAPAAVPVAVTPAPEPVAIPTAAAPAVVTYDDAPAQAEKQLAPF